MKHIWIYIIVFGIWINDIKYMHIYIQNSYLLDMLKIKYKWFYPYYVKILIYI